MLNNHEKKNAVGSLCNPGGHVNSRNFNKLLKITFDFIYKKKLSCNEIVTLWEGDL